MRSTMSKGEAYIPGSAAHISQDPTNRLGRKRTRAQTSGSQVEFSACETKQRGLGFLWVSGPHNRT